MRKTQRDEVDAIVQGWARQRPDTDPSPMLVLSRVARLARHLGLKRREAFAQHDLDPWEFDVLSSLRRAGKPYSMTPGHLMDELLVTSGTMTNRIDRLERRHLVTRSPAPDDRRAVLVTLTPTGKKHVDAALISLLECEKQILAPLSRGDQDDLADLLRIILASYETKY